MQTPTIDTRLTEKITLKSGKGPGTRDKVEAFGWKHLDAPGKMAYLPKTLLRIAPEYQRDLTNERANDIASEFSWLAFGTLLVAHRDGNYYLIDGQHRWAAACKRSDVDRLPCMVFELSGDIADEAAAYVAANTLRRQIGIANKHKALVLAMDDIAMQVERLVQMHGRRVGDRTGSSGSSQTVACVGALHRLMRSHPKVLQRVYPLVSAVCEGKQLHERVLISLVHIEANLVPGQSLLDKAWVDRTVKVGYDGILAGAAKASAFYARGGARIWATGVVQALNVGRQKKLRLATEEDEQEEAA